MDVVKTILRILQLLFVLITTALIGNVIASNDTGRESAINFTMFVCALSWIAAIYGLVSHFVSSMAIPVALLALDSAATLFTFIDAIVLSAKLRAVNCSNFGNKASDWIAFGSHDDEKRCREIQASVVFMWFLFASFAASLFFILNDFRRSGGSVRGPNMSQVGV
ncbi:marvel domain-containing protein [Hypoxylon sp. FL1150]|nr:marvel domain-containing protein [Hypoxylon sp. FL1150]